MTAAHLSRIILMVGRRQRQQPHIKGASSHLVGRQEEIHGSSSSSSTTSGRSPLEQATWFYQQTLGLTVWRATDEWTEFVEVPLSLRAVIGGPNDYDHDDDDEHVNHDTDETEPSHPSSPQQQQQQDMMLPILQFTIPDMNWTVAQGLALGADLDGPIQYPAHGKVATLRTPDGHRIGLYEPAHD
jgi:catechol 2,3-dioxygenase-like lactoylglutathione lyase family enzyme